MDEPFWWVKPERRSRSFRSKHLMLIKVLVEECIKGQWEASQSAQVKDNRSKHQSMVEPSQAGTSVTEGGTM